MAQVVINRGSRIFKLRPGPKKEVRELHPGASIECIDEAEAKLLLGYTREIVDAAKAVPANDDKIKKMQAEIDRLNADNAKLAKKAAEPKVGDVVDPAAKPAATASSDAPTKKSGSAGSKATKDK